MFRASRNARWPPPWASPLRRWNARGSPITREGNLSQERVMAWARAGFPDRTRRPEILAVWNRSLQAITRYWKLPEASLNDGFAKRRSLWSNGMKKKTSSSFQIIISFCIWYIFNASSPFSRGEDLTRILWRYRKENSTQQQENLSRSLCGFLDLRGFRLNVETHEESTKVHGNCTENQCKVPR